MEFAILAFSVPLIYGYVLDLVIGDPQGYPHPVKGFGWLISKSDCFLNNGKLRLIKGMAMSTILVLFVYFSTYFLLLALKDIPIIFQWSVHGTLIYFFLANKSLIVEGKAVFKALDNSIEEGRQRLSWIVGRDTATLNENRVRTAVFETMSENLSDGVVAPLFYYAIGGIPAMAAYKMASTLDSMIGYKNERFIKFGKFAARLDDVANFLPARITAVLIALITLSKRSLEFIFKYGNKHASPNSGYPEAALAGVLDCRFGGPNYYNGILVEKPYIGKNNRNIEPHEINKVSLINHGVALFTIVLIILIKFILLYFSIN